MLRIVLPLIAVLWSEQSFAQTAFLDKREFSARNGVVMVKLGVSHSRQEAVQLTVRLKAAGRDPQTPGPAVPEPVTIRPSEFKIPPGKLRKVMISFEPKVTTRTPYFACVLYQPPVERIDRGDRVGGSMLLATESCSRFWVVP